MASIVPLMGGEYTPIQSLEEGESTFSHVTVTQSPDWASSVVLTWREMVPPAPLPEPPSPPGLWFGPIIQCTDGVLWVRDTLCKQWVDSSCNSYDEHKSHRGGRKETHVSMSGVVPGQNNISLPDHKNHASSSTEPPTSVSCVPSQQSHPHVVRVWQHQPDR